MRKALFISSSRDELNIQQEGNRWHYVLESDDSSIVYEIDNDIPEKRFEPYLADIKSDALIYFASDYSLAYLSCNEFGKSKKVGMIFVYSDLEFVSDNIIAKSIGCTLPNSLLTELNPPYYRSGQNIERYLKQNPIDLGWFQKSDGDIDKHDLKSVLVPILDHLLQLLLNRDKKLKYKRCLLVSANNNNLELGALLKRVLLSLPPVIANQVSFNTNACTIQALNDVDIACIGNWDNLHLPKNYNDEFAVIDIDKGIENYVPDTITCKYILEKNAIPAALKDCSAKTALQLESSISEIKLHDICNESIDYRIIHNVLELYNLVDDKIKDTVKDNLISAAYHILLSKDYFRISEADRDELAKCFLVDSKLRINGIPGLLSAAINDVNKEDGSKFLLFLFEISKHTLIGSATKAISDFLYNGKWVTNESEPTIRLFFNKLKDFEQYLYNIPSKPGTNLENVITAHISEKYVTGKSKIELYLRIREKTNCLWLEEFIFNSSSLSSWDDLKLWSESYKKFTLKNEKDTANKELNILKNQFKESFANFIKGIGFDRTASELCKEIEPQNLELIKSVSIIFGYNEDKELTKKLEEIESVKKRNFVSDVLLYRRCQFLLKAHYPTDKCQTKLFKKYDCAEIPIKNKLITLSDSQGNIKKDNRKEDSKSLHFLNGLSLFIIVPLLILVGLTLFMYGISVNGYGWTLFGSLIRVSAEELRRIFFALIISAYFITYLVSMFIGHKEDIAEKIIAVKACCISTIVFLLPCIGVTLFMMFIG